MEQYSFDQLPRAVSELHQKLDNLQDLLMESRQPLPQAAELMYPAYQAHIFRQSTDSYFWQKTISYGSVRKDVRISPVMA